MPSTALRPDSMDRTQRRTSWTRAFGKMRAAMKRRDSSTRAVPAAQSTQEIPIDAAVRIAQPPSTVAPRFITPRNHDTAPLERPRDGIPVDIEAELDASEDSEETLLPTHSPRTDIIYDRSRDLLSRYGVQFQSRRRESQEEPPTKIRRVEKPVRLRVHWTCHECRAQFGLERACRSCGHRKCRDCIRHPPKRVRDTLDSTRRDMERQEQEQQESATPAAPATATDTTLVTDETLAEPHGGSPAMNAQSGSGPGTSALVEIPNPPVPGAVWAQPLEIDDSVESQDSILPSTPFTIYARRRADVILRANTRLAWRSCHQCATPLPPTSQRDCQNCGHECCDLCPRHPPQQRDEWSEGDLETAREHVSMVRAVQRVYRKPQQRVRYTCENCNSMFVGSDTCTSCGHERCKSCHRKPPKRTPRPHDPEILQAAADRLAAYGSDLGHPPSITTPAG